MLQNRRPGPKSAKRPRRHRPVNWRKIERGAKWLYGVVIGLVLIGLVVVLNDRNAPIPPATPEKAPDTEVAAVLSAMREEHAVPIKDIDKLIPMRAATAAWRQYAAAWPPGKGAKLAIVIDDLGLSEEAADMLATMKGPYTLAFLPYAENLPAQTALMHKAGHELMVHLPMQPHGDSANPGENALLTTLSADEFERRINWNLGRFNGFVGVNNHMGSLLTEDPAAMVRVMMHLKKDGLLFLDSLTSARSVGLRAATATGVPGIARDIFLDNDRDPALILKQLEKAEAVARERGWAVAIGHPYPETLETLKKWRAALGRKDIMLVPLSQLVDERARRLDVAATRQGR